MPRPKQNSIHPINTGGSPPRRTRSPKKKPSPARTGYSAASKESKAPPLFADGTFVRIVSKAGIESLSDGRWRDVFGPKADEVSRDYKKWADLFADVDGAMDERDQSYCIRNVRRLNPGKHVPDIEAGAWWPYELLERANRSDAPALADAQNPLGMTPSYASLYRIPEATEEDDDDSSEPRRNNPPSPGRGTSSSSSAAATSLTTASIPRSRGPLGVVGLDKLAELAPDTNKLDCIAFWKQVLKVEADVGRRVHPTDRETIIHKLVRSDKLKSCKCLLRMDPTLDPRGTNASGRSAIHYACHHLSFKAIDQMLTRCQRLGKWVSATDLVAITRRYPVIIQPYLRRMGFGKEGIDAKLRRFPPWDKNKFYVVGSDAISHGEMWVEERERRLAYLRGSYMSKLNHALRKLDFSDWSSDTTEITVKTRYIACKNIAGQYDNVKESPIGAFLDCGNDDVFTTPIMKAVLDFKWARFGGKNHRWRCFNYLIYIVAVTVMMNDLHASQTTGTFKDMTFPRDMGDVLLADGFFIIETLLLLKGDLIGLYKSGLNRYFAKNVGGWNMAATAIILVNVFIWTVKRFHGVSEVHPPAQITGGLGWLLETGAMNTICAWATVLTWTNMLGLMRPFPSTGPFISMIWSICCGLRPFAVIYMIVTWAFSFAFYMSVPQQIALTIYSETPTSFSFQGPFESFVSAFFMGVGEFADYLKIIADNSFHPTSSLILFWMFTVIVFLVLLNLLIAIMGEAYNTVISDGVEDDWRYFQCAVICEQENHIIHKHDEGYNDDYPQYLHLIEPKLPTLATELSDTEEVLSDRMAEHAEKIRKFTETEVLRQTTLIRDELGAKIDRLTQLLQASLNARPNKRERVKIAVRK